MFDRVLAANRGEIAVRIMRASEELGAEPIAVYSDADRNAGHVRYANQAFNIGPARAAESYLNQDAIIEAARKADADAIHPGYGFLAENPEFAARVEASEFEWVGPSSAAMTALGDKTKARSVMEAAGVPVVPGTTDPVESTERIRALGEEYGYPIAIKAAGGGGGRGLKVVRSPDEIEAAFESAQREGAAYFDDSTVYVEKFLEEPRHIEIQILADKHGNVRHLGERDCSLQRRHQKLIEEALSPALDPGIRENLGEAARRGVKEAEYENAGTVEFLVVDNEYYFLEVNTRIQVEHTVTEELTGIDIVKWQLRIAAGEELDFSQTDITFDGHAIEYRINAENPATDFEPTPGTLTTYDPPGGLGVRVDDAVRQGDEISGDYDSLIAKLIVHAPSRDECLARSIRALREFRVDGVHTTIPFHRLMLTDEAFRTGSHTTKYLDSHLDTTAIATAVAEWGGDVGDLGDEEGVVERSFTVEVNGKRFEVVLEEPNGSTHQQKRGGLSRRREKSVSDDPVIEGEGETITADMQGTILEINVSEGDVVESGDVVCVLEAMKMENDVVTSHGGTVSKILTSEGETVDMGDVLVVIT